MQFRSHLVVLTAAGYVLSICANHLVKRCASHKACWNRKTQAFVGWYKL